MHSNEYFSILFVLLFVLWEHKESRASLFPHMTLIRHVSPSGMSLFKTGFFSTAPKKLQCLFISDEIIKKTFELIITPLELIKNPVELIKTLQINKKSELIKSPFGDEQAPEQQT